MRQLALLRALDRPIPCQGRSRGVRARGADRPNWRTTLRDARNCRAPGESCALRGEGKQAALPRRDLALPFGTPCCSAGDCTDVVTVVMDRLLSRGQSTCWRLELPHPVLYHALVTVPVAECCGWVCHSRPRIDTQVNPVILTDVVCADHAASAAWRGRAQSPHGLLDRTGHSFRSQHSARHPAAS
jgi:hypothetical protein